MGSSRLSGKRYANHLLVPFSGQRLTDRHFNLIRRVILDTSVKYANDPPSNRVNYKPVPASICQHSESNRIMAGLNCFTDIVKAALPNYRIVFNVQKIPLTR